MWQITFYYFEFVSYWCVNKENTLPGSIVTHNTTYDGVMGQNALPEMLQWHKTGKSDSLTSGGAAIQTDPERL